MMHRTADCLARVIATVLTAAPFFSTGAQAEPTAGIGVSGNMEYSNNPYLLDTGNTGAVRARISVSQFIEEQTARSSLRVSADASYSAFNRRYRDAIEDFDRAILKACADKNAEFLRNLPRNKLNAGSSEILNWVALAGAAEHLDLDWFEYVPGYRTPAGTGTGLSFATWR